MTTVTSTVGDVDPAALERFQEKMVGDLGAAMSAVLAHIGDKLGLYRELARNGGMTSQQLAEATGTAERNVREWLASMAAAGYVEYDPAPGTFRMTPEQAAVLAEEGHPAFLQGFIDFIISCYYDEGKVERIFREGSGLPYGDHHVCMYSSTERFFRPLYARSLVQDWLPTLDGVVEKLEKGAKVADVGCGFGASVIIMAQAFPKSRFFGFDFHEPSIEEARAKAREAGVADRATFETADSKKFPGTAYDLVCFFDCLHDMGHPAKVAAHVREALEPDGTWLIVEPFANDDLVANLNPVGRVFYSASTMACVPSAMSQGGDVALGAQAGEARIRKVTEEGGFSRFRRATETPFNLVFEARP